MYRILLIEDEGDLRRSADGVLKSLGHEVVAVEPADAMWLLDDRSFDVVIAGVDKNGGATDLSVTPEVPPVPQALLYLPKPFKPDDLVRAVGELAERQSIARQMDDARATLQRIPASPVVGHSPAMRRITDQLDTVAESEAPVLLTGESGTGKELLARRIHERSPRAGRAMVAVNCAAFPDTLLEAELFGHERGAFTGAARKRDGRFRAADGGTLFLDEINGLSPAAQAKLLRVLQDGVFEPLGSDTSIQVDVRLVSATNQDLRTLVAAGRFREDLYYRVKVHEVLVPPLRQRQGDVPLLVQHFLKKYVSPGRPLPHLTPRAWAALSHYGFPGNVRELEHAIQHALALSGEGEIDVIHLPPELCPPDTVAVTLDGDLRPLSHAVREFEREYIHRALEMANGSRTNAAKLLGISRKHLWHKLKTTAGTPE
jgi:DNA-binding NtrC family response regulator